MDQEKPPSPVTDGGPSAPTAVILSFLAPGLGLVYVGRLLAGLVVNLLFVLIALLFVISTALLEFFPLYPGLVLLGTWVAFCALSGWRAVEYIGDDEVSDGRAFQHPLIYALIALLTFLAPLAMTTHFTARHLLTVVAIDDDAMVPQTWPGDRVLIDRTGYANTTPRPGDPVAITHPHTGELAILRVVGTPSDVIEIHGYTVTINGTPLYSAPANDEITSAPTVDSDDTSEVWVEHNHDRQYLVSIRRGTAFYDEPVELTLSEHQYFLLADNRSLPEGDGASPHHADSRIFGAIGLDQIAGRPTYVAWSNSSDSGKAQLGRVGLPTR